MPRVHHVKSARKAQPEHGIAVGDSYYWWAFKTGGRGGVKRVSKTYPKRSQLTQSDFLAQLYDIEDELSALTAADGEGLAGTIEDTASRLRDLASEQEDKLSNMPDGLQQGPTGEMLQERTDACNNAADELEQIDTDISGKDDDESAEEFWERVVEEAQAVSVDAG